MHDFSSPFDTFDHYILVHRLHTELDLLILSFNLTDRTHYVALSNQCSAFATVLSGISQGSDLGQKLFTMYTKPLSVIIDSHPITHHSYADDIQLQMPASLDNISEIILYMQSCMSDVKAWTTANMLRHNEKAEFMFVTYI